MMNGDEQALLQPGFPRATTRDARADRAAASACSTSVRQRTVKNGEPLRVPRGLRRSRTALPGFGYAAAVPHALSPDDLRFREAFESGSLATADFGHRAHVRLAYSYLAGSDEDTALQRMRAAILGFLHHHAIPATKYHETLTRAWLQAVRHFMDRAGDATSADDFIDRSPVLLDSKIMLTHYSAEVLFSAAARAAFVEPDLDPIPSA